MSDESTPRGRGGVDPIPALIRQVHDLEERLDATGRAVQEIAGELSALADELRRERGPRVVCWVDLEAEAAREAWGELATWIGEVLIPRYEITAEKLPRCWYRHPPMVEALGWLHTTWLAAYRTKNANPSLAAEWHERRLPAALSLIKDQRSGCSLRGGHQEPYRPADRVLDDEAAFAHHVEADVADRARREEQLSAGADTERLPQQPHGKHSG